MGPDLTMKKRVQSRVRQRGQSMLEGALVLTVLLATLLGVLDFGQILFVHQTLTERARGAARYASLNPGDVIGARNLVVFGKVVAPAGADETTRGFWGLTTAMVTVTRNHPDTNEDEMVVAISGYPFQYFSPWLASSVRGRTIIAASPVEL
jgi:Flp pilus assembly protein TadG